jgi:hypothetical protein
MPTMINYFSFVSIQVPQNAMNNTILATSSFNNSPFHMQFTNKIILVVRDGARSTHGRIEKCMQDLDRKTRREEPLGSPRCRWKDNIRMDLREIGCEGVDWIHLAQDRNQWLAVVNTE